MAAREAKKRAGKLKKPSGSLRRRSGSYKPGRESSKTVRMAKMGAGTKKQATGRTAERYQGR
jgi:hypothetical protein